MDKISIITVTYNCVNDIEKTIVSVLKQDYSNIEFIVIDGASTDGTVDIIKKYSDSIDYWVSEPDRGIYYAMNKGIEKSTGDWIYFLNSGGIFHDPKVLSSVFQEQEYQSDAIYGYIYSETLNRYVKEFVPFYKQVKRNKVPGYSHQALFVRSKWCRIYPFDISYRCCADFNQAMTIYSHGAKFSYVDIPIAISPPAGFSAKNRRLQLIENARINKINGVHLLYLIFKFDLKCIVKKLLYVLGLLKK